MCDVARYLNVNIIHYISHIKIISDSNQIIDGNNEEPMKQGDNNDDYLIKKVSVYKFCRNMASINTLNDQYGMKYDIHNHCKS